MPYEQFPGYNEPESEPEHFTREELDKLHARMDDAPQSRRSFLKKAIIGAGALFGTSRLLSYMKDRAEQDEEFGDEAMPGEIDLISYESSRTITPKHIEQLKDAWKRAYTERDHGDTLKVARERIFPLDKKILHAFKNEGVPEFLRYIAIPESEGNAKARSHAGAAGMYQLTSETAKTYGLEPDDRLDPIKSAHAAARILKDIADVADGDWNLALAGYNGSFVWEYLEERAARKESPNYAGFLSFMSAKIDSVRSDVTDGHVTHMVKKGETLDMIGQRFHIPAHSIQSANRTSSGIIKSGQRLIIPLPTLAAKKRAFRVLTRGFRENIEYVPKVHAVAELMDRRAYFKP
jgi:hypothetical protein